MLKAKPVSLRRKSFGGQTGIGIWWRKRSSPTSVIAEQDKQSVKRKRNQEHSVVSIDRTSEGDVINANKGSSSTSTKKAQSCINEPLLGWDDDLCRPIYRYHSHRVPSTDFFDDEIVRNLSSTDIGIADGIDADVNDDLSKISVGTVAVCSDEEKTDNHESQASNPILSRKNTKTFGNRAVRRRPVSLILTHDQEESTPTTLDKGSRRVSLESISDDTPVDTEKPVDDAQANGDILLIFQRYRDSDSEVPKRNQRRSKRLRRSASEDPSKSLEKAREYFANLDQTQSLTLDAAQSPPISSRVTRTRRRTNLASPGINREYRAYARSIVGDGNSGITPLSIKDYAFSRQLHFQNKGQIMDGFLDD